MESRAENLINFFRKASDINREKIKNLAIFNIVVFIFTALKAMGAVFYKICYFIGWLAVFISKFLYLLAARTVNAFSIFSPGILYIHKKIFLLFAGLRRRKARRKPDGYQLKIERKKDIIMESVLELAPVAVGSYEIPEGVFAIPRESQPAMKIMGRLLLFTLTLAAMAMPFKALTFYKSMNLDDVKGKVLGASEKGAADFAEASKSMGGLDFQKAQEDFNKAGNNFLDAKNNLDEVNGLLLAMASIAPDKNLRLAAVAKNFLNAGEYASKLGDDLAAAMDSIIGSKHKDKGLKIILDTFIEFGGKAALDAKNINNELGAVNITDLPEEYQENFSFLRDKSQMLERSLVEFIDLAGKLKDFLGATEDKRYLLVFQNNAELRATGGFIGSYAIIDFHDGKIKNIEAPGGGSYDTEAGLKEKVIAPEPLQLVNPLWHFWDANWWPDWPKSANKLEWFYEKSQSATVDGVISLTPTVIEKILAVIGPVDMTQNYGVVITADNFWLTTERFAEQKPDTTKEPKRIIGDLMTKILSELPGRLDQKTLVGLLAAAQESLDGKQILFYFNDPSLEARAASYGWDGSSKDTPGDYLSVINTNIAGGKSDRKMKETISHDAQIMDDGSIIDSVDIERTHTGIKNEEFSGVRNVDWMRIYVPLGSRLIEATGFRQPDAKYFSYPEACWNIDPDVYKEELTTKTDESSGTRIYEESGYTVFADWSMVDPGETATIHLKYELPFKFAERQRLDTIAEKIKTSLGLDDSDLYAYSLLIQKQAGASPSDIKSNLEMASKFNIVWRYGDGASENPSGWQFAGPLNADKYAAALIQRNITKNNN